MNATPGRTAAFLEEMGIGPLWTLRDCAGPEVDAPIEAESAAQPVVAHAAAEVEAPAAVPAAAPEAKFRPAPSPALPPPPTYQAGHEPRAPMNHPQPPGSAWARTAST